MKTKQRKGFTLIELLIVVAIIGILAVALVPTISDAPARARDATRKALVNSFITQLESFNIDEGRYPEFTGCFMPGGDTSNDAGDLLALVGGTHPSSTRVPGIDGNTTVNCTDTNGTYIRYAGDGVNYRVSILLETGNEDTFEIVRGSIDFPSGD